MIEKGAGAGATDVSDPESDRGITSVALAFTAEAVGSVRPGGTLARIQPIGSAAAGSI
jgi:hypothetical protein